MQIILSIHETSKLDGKSFKNRGIILNETDIVRLAFSKYIEKYGINTDRYTYDIMPYQGEYAEEFFGTFSKRED